MTSPNALREEVESLQNIMIARATGGQADDAGYRSLRETLINAPEIHEALPSFVRTARDLSQFWAFISKTQGYAPRREFIWNAFSPLLDQLENLAAGAAAPAAPIIPAPNQRPSALKQTAKKIRAFISYSTKDKVTAGAVKHALSSAGFDCFLAHDDLQVSEQWRERILEELSRCQVFFALLSANFVASPWGAQEIGIIVGRGDVPIVPLSLDSTLPFGFISHIQGKPLPEGGIDVGAVLEPLARKYPRLAIPILIRRVRDASSFRGAEAALQPLVALYDRLTDEELYDLADAAINNGQVWDASLCRTDYLPEMIEVAGKRLRPEQHRALSHQLLHNEWYPGDEP